MTLSRDLSLWQRIKLASLVLTVPCVHGWEEAHCDKDDEGSHVSDTPLTEPESAMRPEALAARRGRLLPTDSCYCGQAIRWWVKR